MEQRITTYSEYAVSASVSNVRNIESQTLEGIAVEKVYFQPNVNISLAIAQLVSASNSIRALMPAGVQPPIIVQYNASSVPVLQLSLSSDTLNEQQLYDYGLYQVRQQLAPIPGITLPTPAGGKYRQIMVYLDPDALRARGVTPNDVVNAVNAQSLTLPAGDAKLGDEQFIVRVNAMPPSIDALQHLTIKQVGPTTVYLSDVAHVADSWLAQAEHRARRGQASGAAYDHQERRRVHARRGEEREGCAARHPESGAPRHADPHAVRSVGVRAERDHQRAA